MKDFAKILLIVGLAYGLFCTMMLLTGSYATEERITDLPQDHDKWFVSVIGDNDDEQFTTLISWFNDGDLAEFRSQVHFWKVPRTSTAFVRYAENTKVLPTVRVQMPDGYVIYEAEGDGVPSTPADLLEEIAIASEQAEARGLFIDWPILKRPILPYRRHLERQRQERENQCPDNECPDDNYEAPVPPDLGETGPPEVKREGMSNLAVIGISILSLLVGGGAGLVSQFRKLGKG